MSNGVRRTAAAGLKASAGSKYSIKYKKLKSKLGVKGKSAPGSLIQAFRGLQQSMPKRPSGGYKVGGKSVSDQEFRRIGKGKMDAWRKLKPITNGGFKGGVKALQGLQRQFGQSSRRAANDRSIEASRVRGPKENFRRAGQVIKRGVKLVAGAAKAGGSRVPSSALRAGGLGVRAVQGLKQRSRKYRKSVRK